MCTKCKGRGWIPMSEGAKPRAYWPRGGPEFLVMCPDCKGKEEKIENPFLEITADGGITGDQRCSYAKLAGLKEKKKEKKMDIKFRVIEIASPPEAIPPEITFWLTIENGELKFWGTNHRGHEKLFMRIMPDAHVKTWFYGIKRFAEGEEVG